jgi:hypothetical protein
MTATAICGGRRDRIAFAGKRFARRHAGMGSGVLVPAGWPLPDLERAARAAFPSGDLPEAPGGGRSSQKGEGTAALSRVAMARDNYFPPPPPKGAALHREAK